MEALRVIMDLEQQGFSDEAYEVHPYQDEITIGGMPRGTEAGKPTVLIGLKHPDPECDGYLVVETTLALLLTAADTLKAKYGDPRE